MRQTAAKHHATQSLKGATVPLRQLARDALGRLGVVAMRQSTYDAFLAEIARLRQARHVAPASVVPAVPRPAISSERPAGGIAASPASQVSAMHQMTAERDGYKGAYEQLVAERTRLLHRIGTLDGERAGLRGAYDTLQSELGILRSTAAPVVRSPAEREQHKGPGIFLVTLPKSGTVFVASTLATSLGLWHTSTMVSPTFPKNIIWPEMLEDFKHGGMLSVSHLQPDDENIAMLRAAGVTRGVLHLRDPRAAVHSWIHFVRRGFSPLHPLIGRNGYHQLAESEQIDHMIEHAFPHMAAWIEAWCSRLDREPDLDFLMIRHEDLVRDEKAYFDRILAYYGIPGEARPIEKSAGTHFRMGDNEDWRRSFTPAQRNRVNELMPASLWSRFGWQP